MPEPQAGYSGTPLVEKLGYKPGFTAAHLDAPPSFAPLLVGLRDDVVVTTALRGHAHLVVCFVTERRRLVARLPGLHKAIAPDGMAWIAWPKKSSGVATDITEDTIRAVILPTTDLVDVKICAIDATWSGLKLVIRKERR